MARMTKEPRRISLRSISRRHVETLSRHHFHHRFYVRERWQYAVGTHVRRHEAQALRRIQFAIGQDALLSAMLRRAALLVSFGHRVTSRATAAKPGDRGAALASLCLAQGSTAPQCRIRAAASSRGPLQLCCSRCSRDRLPESSNSMPDVHPGPCATPTVARSSPCANCNLRLGPSMFAPQTFPNNREFAQNPASRTGTLTGKPLAT